jgi:hypothetical protein
MWPQVVLQDNDLSRQDAANEIKFGLTLLQEAANIKQNFSCLFIHHTGQHNFYTAVFT